MDGTRFDRLTKTLVASLRRRDALRTLAASGFATLGVSFAFEAIKAKKKNKKRRCRKRRSKCGGKIRCCGENNACRSFPTASCLTLSGRYCCGLEGAPCSNEPTINNCDCCSGLFCGGIMGEPGRCQEEPS